MKLTLNECLSFDEMFPHGSRITDEMCYKTMLIGLDFAANWNYAKSYLLKDPGFNYKLIQIFQN